jgi:flagellar protein FliO/FliZ
MSPPLLSNPAASTTAPASPALSPAASFGPPLLPILGLGLLAVAAWVFAKRKRRRARLVQVLDTADLGAKRSLVVAQMGGQTFLLGSSEAGIHLLHAQPASPEAMAVADAQSAQVPLPVSDAATAPAPWMAPPPGPSARSGLLQRMLGRSRAPAPAFDAMLEESAEDQELRRKLVAGMAGRVA